jgi:ABC-type phosphate transport system auxiliary subunit
MIRSVSRWLLFLAPVALVGCSSDPREEYITRAVQYINDATNHITTIKDQVDKAISQAKDKKLSAKELREANSSIDGLRELGKKMQLVKQGADGASTTLTAEEKEELRKQYQTKVQGALTALEESRVELQTKLQEAEAIDPEGIRELRNQLTQAEGVFAVLARRQ